MNEVLNSFGSIATIDSQYLLLGTVFLAVIFVVAGAAGLLLQRDPLERRLMTDANENISGAGGGTGLRDSFEASRRTKGIEKLWIPQDEAERSQVRNQLFRAGYRRPSAVRKYYTARFVLGLMFPLTVAAAFPALSTHVDIKSLLFVTAILIAAGFYGPAVWLTRGIQRRQEEVRNSFPDALDMLLVCVEAGLGLDAALDRVAHEIRTGHKILSEELTLCGMELRAGKARADVLRDFGKRVDVDDVRAFVSVLTQSDRYGTNLADAVRLYSSDMRAKRLVRAEEKANKLPIKLGLGAMFFTLPPVFIILISPAAISTLRFLNRLSQ